MKLTDNSPFKMNSVLMLNKQSLSSKNIKLKKLNPDLPSVKYLLRKKEKVSQNYVFITKQTQIQ